MSTSPESHSTLQPQSSGVKRWVQAFTVGVALASGMVAAQPSELEGVKIPAHQTTAGTPLVLNGAGVRVKVFFKVYVAALYTPQKAQDATALLAQKGPRRMVITLLRDVSAQAFTDAIREGLTQNHTEAQLAVFKPQTEALFTALMAHGEAKKGDVVLMDFEPGVGTHVTVNGQSKGPVLPGDDFFTALLRIWLGDKPVDVGLKKGLLGGV